jgi:pimeloyl-ACP methyl ester carboxylesterase
MSEHSEAIGGLEGFWLEHASAPVLYLHGVPNSSGEWGPFLERTGGFAPDLPGFGRSGKPASFDYSIPGYDRWIEAFADHVGLDRFSLVVHDWGVVGLATAQRLPERMERLVVIAGVPLLPGYEWHRWARIWRTPFAGEMAMGLSTKWAARRDIPAQLIDEVWEHFDHGTQRAILKLYRSAPPEVLEKSGRDLGRIDCPTLVLWPDQDPYIGAEFGPAYAEAVGGNAELRVIEGAGHWPWLDRPDVIDDVAAFLSG